MIKFPKGLLSKFNKLLISFMSVPWYKLFHSPGSFSDMHRKTVKKVLAEQIKSGFSGDFQCYPQNELPDDFGCHIFNDAIQQSDF